MTIDDAMVILEEAVAVAAGETIQTPDVWEALDTLTPHCPERWPLTQFWRDAGYQTDHPSARYQGVNAALNGIARQLGRPRIGLGETKKAATPEGMTASRDELD